MKPHQIVREFLHAYPEQACAVCESGAARYLLQPDALHCFLRWACTHQRGDLWRAGALEELLRDTPHGLDIRLVFQIVAPEPSR